LDGNEEAPENADDCLCPTDILNSLSALAERHLLDFGRMVLWYKVDLTGSLEHPFYVEISNYFSFVSVPKEELLNGRMTFPLMDGVRRVATEYFEGIFTAHAHSLRILDVRVINEVLVSRWPMAASPLYYDHRDVSRNELSSDESRFQWCRILVTSQKVDECVGIVGNYS
jgi:hypothetical protein